MHLNAELQQDEDQAQALKDKVLLPSANASDRLFQNSPPHYLPDHQCHQAAQIRQVLATGAISGAQKLAQMAGKAKTQLQETEAEVSTEKGSVHAMVDRLGKSARGWMMCSL